SALQLFTENGYAETSLSDITKRAGANIAAVNYHFGSKEDLYLAVLDSHFLPILKTREKRLSEVEDMARKNHGKWDLQALLCSWLDPWLEAYKEPGGAGRIIIGLEIQVLSSISRGEIADWPNQYKKYKSRFDVALVRAVQHLPADTVIWRGRMLTTSLVNLLNGVSPEASLELTDTPDIATMRSEWLAAGEALFRPSTD
ncbi:MAG: TetR/AcrR family transcriptional regulator, partial [Haliea sp.]